MLTGALITVCFFIALLSSFYLGYRFGHRRRAEKPTQEELQRIKRMEEGFQNVLNYDYSKALERGRK